VGHGVIEDAVGVVLELAGFAENRQFNGHYLAIAAENVRIRSIGVISNERVAVVEMVLKEGAADDALADSALAVVDEDQVHDRDEE
jgi:hypothetical protein